MLPASPPPLVFTKNQAAETLQIGISTVHKLVKSGALRSIKIGRRVLIPKEALNDFLEGKE